MMAVMVVRTLGRRMKKNEVEGETTGEGRRGKFAARWGKAKHAALH